jgi:hypothetical protein
MRKVRISVEHENALEVEADVLALKYAQANYGIDAAVTTLFVKAGRPIPFAEPWSFRLEPAPKGVLAAKVLVVGVPGLQDFNYPEIRKFARRVMSALADQAPATRHLAITVHGPGYGLDEHEAFEAEIAGLVDAVQANDIPESLERVTVVERNLGRAKRLADVLARLLPGGFLEADSASRQDGDAPAERLRDAGYASAKKARVFVAMPFKDEMDDVFHYGIQSAVNAAGLLCERADLSSFTGDVIEWVRNRIRTASLVVADLSEANPNVYLEVGYAWGVGVPTVLVVRETDHLRFDVRGQRCLVYKKIKHLEDLLTNELKQLRQAA